MVEFNPRRRHPRVEAASRCWVESPGVTLYARLTNVSVGGLFVRTSTPIAPGTPIRVRWSFDDDAETIEARAIVAWTREPSEANGAPPGMGLSFQAPDPRTVSRIDAYIAAQLG